MEHIIGGVTHAKNGVRNYIPHSLALSPYYFYRFITLPANATNLTQPLDVCVFKGMKSLWRKQLLKYRKLPLNKVGLIRKSDFPGMLATLVGSQPEDALVELTRKADEVQPRTKRKRTGVQPGKALRPKDLHRISFYDEEKWWCFVCQVRCTKADEAKYDWIACDTCSITYHAKWTGLVVPPNTPIGDVPFECDECDP